MIRNSEQSWRSYYPFLFLFNFNLFFSCSFYGLVLPEAWIFIDRHKKEDELLAYVLSSFSIGEILGALFFGCYVDYILTKCSLLLSLLIGLAGSILSFCVHFFNYTPSKSNFMLLLLSRLLQGIWNGGFQAIEQTHVSEVVLDIGKLRILSENGISSVCGYILGPVLGVGLTFLHGYLKDYIQISLFSFIDLYQIVIITVLVLMNFRFDDVPISMRANRTFDLGRYDEPNKKGVIVSIAICFFLFNGFTVQETITGPLVTDKYQVINI